MFELERGPGCTGRYTPPPPYSLDAAGRHRRKDSGLDSSSAPCPVVWCYAAMPDITGLHLSKNPRGYRYTSLLFPPPSPSFLLLSSRPTYTHHHLVAQRVRSLFFFFLLLFFLCPSTVFVFLFHVCLFTFAKLKKHCYSRLLPFAPFTALIHCSPSLFLLQARRAPLAGSLLSALAHF